jgi:Mg-chelatase subunit ChlD
MQESVMGLVRDLEAIDTDGIDVVELGGALRTFTGVNSQKVREIFETMNPRGSTPLAQALTNAFKAAGKSAKKDFIVVFTDGVPDDEGAVKDVILKQANSQETDDSCTVLFIQVGDDARATAYLKGLDDNLKGAKYDIVDAKTIAEADAFPSTAELIYAAIND